MSTTEHFMDILEKHKLQDGVVHNQQMSRREVVETLLAKQHEAELARMVERYSPAELGEVLDELPLESAAALWHAIPRERENDVLWELSDSRREALAAGREPQFEGSKVNVFELVDGGRLRQVPVTGRKDLDGVKPVWVDLINSSASERGFIGAHFEVELPDPLEATDLELSSRFYIGETDDIYLHSNFLRERAGDSRSVPVSFILHGGILFSVRDEELPVFRLQRRRALTQPGYVSDSIDVLLDLYGADVECSADSLEDIYTTLGEVGRLVLNETVTDAQAARILASIAEEEDQNGRVRGNILDTQRALNFLMRARLLKTDQVQSCNQIVRNIESLNSHTAFLFDKINFLMDATIGFININQNKRVNQLTVFSVVFMPLNMLAGIGGMSEYSMMTEGIPWPISYGAFVLGSGLIGFATYVALHHFETRRQRPLRGRQG
jgi:magnesium transporter